MERSPVIAVVLAAGGSTRMGAPKALLRWDDTTLIARHVAGFRSAGMDVRVATGGHADEVESATRLAGALPCPNPRWASTGPFESLRCCLANLPVDTRLLVTPVDVPPAPSSVIRMLLRQAGPAVPQSEGQDVHPVCTIVRDVLAAAPGWTLRDCLRTAPRVAVDFPDGRWNLNTPEAFQEWRASVGTRD